MHEWIYSQLLNMSFTELWANWIAGLSLIGLILIGSVLADFLVKKILLKGIQKLVSKSQIQWDDLFFDHKLLNRVSHFAPLLVLFVYLPQAFPDHETWLLLTEDILTITLILLGILVLDTLLNNFLRVYQHLPASSEISIKGFVQVIKIIIVFISGILIVGIVIDKSPLYLLSGLGALTAVLMLIFKDSILGFVAGIQLITNRMIALGDWIEMPKYGADGDVIDIALTTVKVQNWDKTITTIPTYALISESFKNWRGMQNSGGRRIKRAIYLDVHSIKFCTPEMLAQYQKIDRLKEYLDNKLKNVDEDNRSRRISEGSTLNGRRLTNIGTFRAYVNAYLREHPQLNKEMTFLVRQLAPTEHGLPIEIYVFSSDKVWANYEAIQADIFDHILASVPEFELSLFQHPTGKDFSRLLHSIPSKL